MEPNKNQPNENIFVSDVNFIHGISCIRTGHFTPSTDYEIACATQGGELKICSWDDQANQWIQDAEFDLSENGAIWSMECIDINGDGLDEIIIGGMQGVVICVDAKGNELWTQSCSSSISGIRIWNVSSDPKNPNLRIMILSLDRTLRVLDIKGKLLWAQMFGAGVACVDIGDCDKDGSEEVVAGGNDSTLRIFEGLTGKIKWFKTLTQNIRSVLIHDYKIFCGGDDRTVSIYDGITQNLLFSKEFPTFVWNIRYFSPDHGIILLSTYSFKFLGDDETKGDPAIYLLKAGDLTELWSKKEINVQDVVIFPTLDHDIQNLNLLIGDTGGTFMWNKFSFDGRSIEQNHTSLPSLINSVNTIEIGKSETAIKRLLVAGCDDNKIYTWIFEKVEKK